MNAIFSCNILIFIEMMNPSHEYLEEEIKGLSI